MEVDVARIIQHRTNNLTRIEALVNRRLVDGVEIDLTLPVGECTDIVVGHPGEIRGRAGAVLVADEFLASMLRYVRPAHIMLDVKAFTWNEELKRAVWESDELEMMRQDLTPWLADLFDAGWSVTVASDVEFFRDWSTPLHVRRRLLMKTGEELALADTILSSGEINDIGMALPQDYESAMALFLRTLEYARARQCRVGFYTNDARIVNEVAENPIVDIYADNAEELMEMLMRKFADSHQ